MTGGRFVQVEGLCQMIINLMKEWRNDGREVCAGGGGCVGRTTQGREQLQ